MEGTGAKNTILSAMKYSLEKERNMVWVGTVEGTGADQRRDQILDPGSALPLIDASRGGGWLSVQSSFLVGFDNKYLQTNLHAASR